VKKISAIGLILLLSLQCFYKLGVITYFHVNRGYIAEILCINKEKPAMKCHGRCFLEKTLDLADDTASNEGVPPIKNQIADFPVFLVSENFSLSDKHLSSPTGNSGYRQSISFEHHPTLFRPPALFRT
jgi:hypothetical protein